MQFLEIKSFSDLSSFFEMEPKKLGYMIYKLPRNKLYESFSIEKKNGSKRKINAPKVQLKKMYMSIPN